MVTTTAIFLFCKIQNEGEMSYTQYLHIDVNTKVGYRLGLSFVFTITNMELQFMYLSMNCTSVSIYPCIYIYIYTRNSGSGALGVHCVQHPGLGGYFF